MGIIKSRLSSFFFVAIGLFLKAECSAATPAQPISIWKAQSRKKSPQDFMHLVNFSKNGLAIFDNHKILLFWL